MKFKLKFLLLFLFAFQGSYAQNIEVLQEDRGYKEIKLGNDISRYNCFEQIGKATGMQSLSLATGGINQSKILVHKFVPNSDYPYYAIGDIKIYSIEVMTYDKAIYEIEMYVQPHVDILPILEYRFGDYTDYDDVLLPIYTWKASNGIVCELIGYGGSDKFQSYILKYTDEKLTDLMEREAENQREIDRRKKENKLREQARSDF